MGCLPQWQVVAAPARSAALAVRSGVRQGWRGTRMASADAACGDLLYNWRWYVRGAIGARRQCGLSREGAFFSMAYSVTEFVSDVDTALNERGVSMETSWSLGPKLQQLVSEGGDLTLQGEASSGSSGLGGRILHVDADKRFRPGGRALRIRRADAGSRPPPVGSGVRHFGQRAVHGVDQGRRRKRPREGGPAGADRSPHRAWRHWLLVRRAPATSTGSGRREASLPAW